MTNARRSRPPLAAALLPGILLLLLLTAGRAGALPAEYNGRVLDAVTGKPIAAALVTVGSTVVRTDRDGAYHLAGEDTTLAVRAVGYRRVSLPAADFTGKAPEIRLPPFAARALYLSGYGIGSRILRNAALKLIRQSDLNALVIDIKDDKGLIPYKTALPPGFDTGARAVTTVQDMAGLVRSLRAEGLYLIARIVVFKDNPLALARPGWAVRTKDDKIWRDREGLAWVDPFQREAWPYTIAIAVDAARIGFDEIQFDYIRFPDTGGIVFSKPNTAAERVRTITEFLATARRALAPYNVFTAADIFGYVLWNTDDTGIGQTLEDLPAQVDFLSPMLYPTTFQFGIPGHKIPVADPYAIVFKSLQNARGRLGLAPASFRPWLQAFRDYAFDRRQFGGDQIRAQIRAATDFGAAGWMLWNPLNRYQADGLPGIPITAELVPDAK